MIAGVDVSSYQPTNYDTSGLSFVFVKATEGTGYVNPLQAGQAAHGRAAGLVVGFYHYLDSSASMWAQAEYFVRQCDSVPGDILACDWEESSVSGADKDAFLAAVRQLRPSHRLVLYCNTYFWKNLDTTSDCADGLWIADITTAGRPRVQHPWTFHQYSDSGGIDRDVGNFGSATELVAWATHTDPTPPPWETDMPQWIAGSVTPGAEPTVVLVPHGNAWSTAPHRCLHLGMDTVGDPSARASVRVAIHNGSGWRESTATVSASGGTVDVDLTNSDVKISLQTGDPGVAYAVETW
ncbi:glycoside hydrolase family 25 protein [Streptantibioticus rubrisoli]|uniref:glycoside hydrolase family 25 protein n=1 Tax=Streptantibioticus rubrisoli TaxID=1387313 RepID=UPI0027E316B4|nr:GH25 family lysozyme [Streptantibioticus rubrisoli]